MGLIPFLTRKRRLATAWLVLAAVTLIPTHAESAPLSEGDTGSFSRTICLPAADARDSSPSLDIPRNLTLVDFLDYLRLLGYGADPIFDTAAGHARMRFFVFNDYGFAEVHKLNTATEPLDPRKTAVYENLGDLWGEAAFHCRATDDTPPVSLPYATDEEKLDYIERYVIKQRQFNFVLLIDNCAAEVDLIAPHIARLRHDFSRFTPERYRSLKDEAARIEELRRILLLPVPDEYSRAMKRFSPEAHFV